MKAVLISIRPQGCEKIASGEKTIVERKTKPKLQTPFKCYIYCTKPSKKYQTICGCMVINTDELYRLPSGEIKHDWSGELMCCNGEYSKDNFLNGKVIGEFVCDKVDFFFANYCDNGSADLTPSRLIYGLGNANSELAYLDKCCLTHDELFNYIISGKYGFGWHITDLKIYDKPRELSEFVNYDKYQLCKEKNCFSDNCWICPNNPIVIRPPQSWCYVEEV